MSENELTDQKIGVVLESKIFFDNKTQIQQQILHYSHSQ